MAFYSFDTSSLLNGRRDLLPPDTFPTLWERIAEMITNGSIRAPDEVDRELSRRDDEVSQWAKAQKDLFAPLDAPLQRQTRAVLDAHPRLTGRGKGRNAADPFVIALAQLARDGVVVTEETSKSIENPKIPDVCDALGIRCIGLITFVREQNWTF